MKGETWEKKREEGNTAKVGNEIRKRRRTKKRRQSAKEGKEEKRIRR